MAYIKVDNTKVTKEVAEQLKKICPFNAFTYENGILSVNDNCKICKVCVRRGPEGVCTLVEDETYQKEINKADYKGILVYCEHHENKAHAVSWELVGKARELASVTKEPVYVVVIGYNVKHLAEEALTYGVDKVFLYDDKAFENFDCQVSTNVLEDLFKKIKYNILLVGATPHGRSFAPRVAARLRTGMTADCTRLEVNKEGDLSQIRPAFGGNVMAHIKTVKHRPQMATVRYKMFDKPPQVEPKGEIVVEDTSKINKNKLIELIERINHPQAKDIVDSEILICVGRGFKAEKDLELIEPLRKALKADVACTRPLIEKGWFDPRLQVGLSGRTVKPKLMINIGISGAVHFIEGIKDTETIISISNDPDCKLFNVSHYSIVGDLYEILPELNKLLEEVA